MNSLIILYAAVLFFLMTPKILFHLPFKGGKFTSAAIHSILFAVVFYLTSWLFSKTQEGACNYSHMVNKYGQAKDSKTAAVNQKLDASKAADAYKGKWICSKDNNCKKYKDGSCWIKNGSKDATETIIDVSQTSGVNVSNTAW